MDNQRYFYLAEQAMDEEAAESVQLCEAGRREGEESR